MADRASFLAAVQADPEDDAPRLVYADWLQDNGDPDRAEFIRVQVELARHKRSTGAATTENVAARPAPSLHASALADSNETSARCEPFFPGIGCSSPGQCHKLVRQGA